VSSPEQQQWRAQVHAYAEAINAYAARGLKAGWKKAGKQPPEPDCASLAPLALAAVRDANRTGQLDDLKALWPPAHGPFVALLKENGQAICTLCVLGDGTILARIGAPYEQGRVVRIHDRHVEDVPDVAFFGFSPDRRTFAIATPSGVRLTDGWQGPERAFCPWARGNEDLPPEVGALPPWGKPPKPVSLTPFPDSDRVLLVSEDAIFVLSPSGATRLLPTPEQIISHVNWIRTEQPGDEASVTGLSMAHGAVSPDGGLIAVGCQDSQHLVFDRDLACIAEVGPHGEYPHFALFSTDGATIAFNACHFYNGGTIAVPVDLLPGHKSDFYEEVDGITLIEPNARVYAGVSRGDDFILGDANGYLNCVSRQGDVRWRHFIGSTVSAMDISADGKTLVAATYAGFVSIIQLDAGRKQPYQIGTGDHLEVRRWLFWKEEPQPLAW